MTALAPAAAAGPHRSVFTGADVCRESALALTAGSRRPVFNDDMWDFTAVIGLPTQMRRANRRFDFTTIADPRWRLVAKELILAMLAPRHEAVAPLPRAYRTPLHLNTASGRLAELVRWFAWLSGRVTPGRAAGDDPCGGAHLAEGDQVRDDL